MTSLIKLLFSTKGDRYFFGRTTEAKAFFVNMGFDCAERATTGDFLTSLTNPAERVIRDGYEKSVPRTPDEFAARWQESEESASACCRTLIPLSVNFPLVGSNFKSFRNLARPRKQRGSESNLLTRYRYRCKLDFVSTGDSNASVVMPA